MYSFNIGLVTNPKKLRKVFHAPVGNLEDIYLVIQEMSQICSEHNGLGISAIQIGVPWKISLIAVKGKDTFRAFVNCNYKPDKKKGQISFDEGCLSLPGELYNVSRWKKIRLQGFEFNIDEETQQPRLDRVSELFYFDSSDPICVTIQHEIDHQNGILISDHGVKIQNQTSNIPPKWGLSDRLLAGSIA